VLVPPHVALNVELFAYLDQIDHKCMRIECGGGAVLAGPAHELARSGKLSGPMGTFSRLEIPAAACLDLSTAGARRTAAWTILHRAEKPTDGWVSRRCNRPISRVISWLLLSCGLSASHASVLTLLLGLATATIAAQPGYIPLVTAAVLFQLASIVDGVDGEMARSTLTESEAGARLDTIIDQVTYVVCFAGVTIGWVREGGGVSAIVWTIAVGLALVLSLARGGRFVARHADNASFVFIDRAVRRAARDTGRTTLQLAAAAFTLLRRDVFAVVFFLVALTGQRALIPALIFLGVIVANVTFTTHHRELADAAVAERLSPTAST
jgi:CDP-L-myo-inositol myo-inositolphosphotransferase